MAKDKAEDKNELEDLYRIIHNPSYKFNDNYGLVYLTYNSYELLSNSLSRLRQLKEMDGYCYHVISSMYKHQYQNYHKILYLDSIQPRLIAQKFIGKRIIREFILKRDKYKCLRCGRKDKLTIDHILSVYCGGENKLSNLQTLCKSCNSIKSTDYIDYRGNNNG